jgi:hypothetical protein
MHSVNFLNDLHELRNFHPFILHCYFVYEINVDVFFLSIIRIKCSVSKCPDASEAFTFHSSFFISTKTLNYNLLPLINRHQNEFECLRMRKFLHEWKFVLFLLPTMRNDFCSLLLFIYRFIGCFLKRNFLNRTYRTGNYEFAHERNESHKFNKM